MRLRHVVVASLAMVWLTAASTNGQTSGRIVTRTRLVAVFSDLQNQWLEAVQKKDTATLDRLLGEEYQV
jgi:hypothetical protein